MEGPGASRETAGARDDTSTLLPLVYDELRALARRLLARERGNHTLQPTALVHEAYLRLMEQPTDGWKSRAYFFGAAARTLRRILVNHAEGRRALKRGGDLSRVDLAQSPPVTGEPALDLIALDELLEELEALDPRQSRIVELRFFGGLSIDEIARVLQVSPRTVDGEWAHARAWLRARLLAGGGP